MAARTIDERVRLARIDSRIAKVVRELGVAARKGDKKAAKALQREFKALTDVRGTTDNWTWKTEPEPNWDEGVAAFVEAAQRRALPIMVMPRVDLVERKRSRKQKKAEAARQQVQQLRMANDVTPRRRLNIGAIEEAG